MDDPGLGGLIEGRSDGAVGSGRFVLFAAGRDREKAPLQGLEAAFEAVISQVFAGAAAHPAFGRFCIGHISVFQIRAEPSETRPVVNKYGAQNPAKPTKSELVDNLLEY